MDVDHSATDEVEWQARELASSHGIADQYTWNWEDQPDSGVGDALSAFEDWLQSRGFTFLFFVSGSDSFAGVVVPNSKAIADTATGKRRGHQAVRFLIVHVNWPDRLAK